MNSKKLMVKPGKDVNLADHDPDDTHGLTKAMADRQLEKHRVKLDQLQELLYAGKQHALLIVLQAMDAGGKDGTIRHVMAGVNPQSCHVASFKAPTDLELGHDFLWRVHKVVPIKGTIGIFNRSHYEDVLIARVHKLVPKSVWSKRYAHINDFERLLADSDVKILKFFLHISKDEQLRRFQSRLSDPAKNWKLSMPDFSEREHWDEYMEAYEDALTKCSTKHAPWYVIPSNQKWFRNYAISCIAIEALERMKLKYPPASVDVSKIKLS